VEGSAAPDGVADPVGAAGGEPEGATRPWDCMRSTKAA